MNINERINETINLFHSVKNKFVNKTSKKTTMIFNFAYGLEFVYGVNVSWMLYIMKSKLN